jgi:hypothetical protein
MLRRSFVAGVPALITFGSLAGSSGCQPAAVVSTYELSGIISERFESGMNLAPLANARVLFTSDTGLTFETMSGGDGRYRMQVVTDSRFGQVRAELEGFEPAETTVLFDTPSRRIDIDLRRARA